MPDTVKIPGIGETKKAYAYIGGGLVLGIGGYAYYKYYENQAAQTAAAETANAPAQSIGTDMATDSGTGGYDYTGSAASSSNVSSNVIATNADWTQQATAYLSGLGYDQQTVASTLGAFLAHQSLTSTTQQQIVQAAIAAYGNPPTGGPFNTSINTPPSPSVPGSVTGIKATVLNDSEIQLTWSPTPGAAHYYIYVDTLAYNQGETPTTTFKIVGLQPHTTHKIYMKAANVAYKQGPLSGPITVKTAPIKLKAPTGVKVIGTTRTTVTLRWNPVSGAQYYRVYRSGSSANVGATDAVNHSITIGGLKPNTSYKFEVAADTVNNYPGPKSSSVTGKTTK